MKNKFLTYISEEEYLRKRNDDAIDWAVLLAIDDPIIINKFLKGKRRPTKVHLRFRAPATTHVIYSHQNAHYYAVYDRIDNFRLPVPNEEPVKSVRCAFTSPHSDLKQIKEDIKKPWINHDYNIYLVNPSLYRVVWNGTVTLAHVRNLDHRHFKGMTDYCVNSINELMIEGTGEPLFYII